MKHLDLARFQFVYIILGLEMNLFSILFFVSALFLFAAAIFADWMWMAFFVASTFAFGIGWLIFDTYTAALDVPHGTVKRR